MPLVAASVRRIDGNATGQVPDATEMQEKVNPPLPGHTAKYNPWNSVSLTSVGAEQASPLRRTKTKLLTPTFVPQITTLVPTVIINIKDEPKNVRHSEVSQPGRMNDLLNSH